MPAHHHWGPYELQTAEQPRWTLVGNRPGHLCGPADDRSACGRGGSVPGLLHHEKRQRSATESRATTAIHTPLPARRAGNAATTATGIGRTMHSTQTIPQTVERLAGTAERSVLSREASRNYMSNVVAGVLVVV